MSNFSDVGDFHRKFDLPVSDEYEGSNPRLLTIDELKFRSKFMREEFNEFMDAAGHEDLAGMADALVDLVYVAMGTAHMMGLPWETLWSEVQRANMQKERAVRVEQSKRGSTLDVIKPDGWTPPDIQGCIDACR